MIDIFSEKISGSPVFDHEIQKEVPDGITAQLRSYQKTGFSWLVYLYENNFGGCLADDMGLGKTLQFLTFFQYIYRKTKETKTQKQNTGYRWIHDTAEPTLFSLPPTPSSGGGAEHVSSFEELGKRAAPPPEEGAGGRLYQEALSKATRLCSLSEKCEQDIREKLSEWQLSIENTEKIIAYLKEEKYLDEMRFARFFAQDKHRFAKWGKSKIIFMLKNKGVSSEAIEEAVKNIDFEDYSEQLKSLLTSKYKSIKYKNLYDAKAKLYRFGMSKGFESELVLRTIDEILNKK